MNKGITVGDNILKECTFSDDGKHRIVLTRIWNRRYPIALCIGLNPSTADGLTDDSTIRQLLKFLPELGFGGFHMMNLYSLITSKPGKLHMHPDPCPKDNIDELERIGRQADEIIFCWGAFKGIEYRAREVSKMFRNRNPRCFGKTASGAPNHPMNLMWTGVKRTSVELIPFHVEQNVPRK